MIAVAILLSIAGTTLLWSIIAGSVTGNEFWFLGLIITILCSIVGIGMSFDVPTNNDVKEGKAHYIEQNHIEVVNGDTVNNYKTYKIEWIENFK